MVVDVYTVSLELLINGKPFVVWHMLSTGYMAKPKILMRTLCAKVNTAVAAANFVAAMR